MDLETIYNEMRDSIAKASGVSPRTGGDMELRLRAFAAQLETLWIHADWLSRQCLPQTASGTALDYHAELRGLTRAEAVKAQGELRFSVSAPPSAPIAVAPGVTCVGEDGTAFVTTEGGAINIGETSVTVRAEAKAPGAIGNAPAYTVTTMTDCPAGVEFCENPSAFTGGCDSESDDALRARVVASYSSLPNGANAAYYETAALNTPGVAAVRVRPKARGLGTVDVIIAAESGIPSDALLEEVRDRLLGAREICVDIEVSAPTEVRIDLAASVTPAQGFTFDEAKADAIAALTELFTGRELGENVLAARLGSTLFALKSVKNCKIITPDSDISISEYQLPVPDTVAVTQLEEI